MVTVSFGVCAVVAALLAQTGLPEQPPHRINLWTAVWLVVAIFFLVLAAIAAPWDAIFD